MSRSRSVCMEDDNAFAVRELTDENERLEREIEDWKKRILMATDFTQSEMDDKEVCKKCNIPYHPDYCYNRQGNDGGATICDVCYEDKLVNE